jgi:hypothetical protein
MTFTIKPEQFYLIIIFILMVIQIFQWRFIHKLKDEIDYMWNQIEILVGTVGKEIKQLQEKINDIKK